MPVRNWARARRQTLVAAHGCEPVTHGLGSVHYDDLWGSNLSRADVTHNLGSVRYDGPLKLARTHLGVFSETRRVKLPTADKQGSQKKQKRPMKSNKPSHTQLRKGKKTGSFFKTVGDRGVPEEVTRQLHRGS